MQKYPIWKPVLIVLVVAACLAFLYPPERTLRGGPDLTGGTVLIYAVEIDADSSDPQGEIEDVIAVLRERIDPDGVKNLIWTPIAGNRIEIVVPAASPMSDELRRRFETLKQEISRGNLSAQALSDALRDQANRDAALDRIADDDAERRALLDELAIAYDKMDQARQTYDALRAERAELEANINALPDDAAEEQREGMTTLLTDIRQSVADASRQLLAAQRAYAAIEARVLSSNISSAELTRVFNLPDKVDPDAREEGETKTVRELAIEKLLADHPDRRADLTELIEVFRAYSKVRGMSDDPNDVIELLRGQGVLEFRIVAGPPDAPNGIAQTEIDRMRQALKDAGPSAEKDGEYRWFKIKDIAQFADRRAERDAMRENPSAYFESRGMIGDVYGGEFYLLLANRQRSAMTRHQNWKLTDASRTVDQQGFAAVSFSLDAAGASLMNTLTSNHLQQPMAIVLDDQVVSAPNINSAIAGSGIITGGQGGFGQEEQRYLVRTLRAGNLASALSYDPILVQKIGATFGRENLRRGLSAAIWSLIIVAIFMAIYYYFLGMVANFALVANIIIILGIMAMLKATFTLPGIAGIVLTVGMAVDANVLIFERIREELERRVDLVAAVRVGYQKAFSTIVDANITTLITAIVLYMYATADVKGFALVLAIGIIASMFTSLFCSRVIVDLYIRWRRPKTLTMLPSSVGAVRNLLSPNVNWVGKRMVFFGISALLMVGGIALVASRNVEMLDIEFRSGTKVAFDLTEGHATTGQDAERRIKELGNLLAAMQQPGFTPAAEQAATVAELERIMEESRSRAAREDIEHTPLSELANATVLTLGELGEGGAARSFSVMTLATDGAAVSEVIKLAFEGGLEVTDALSFKGVDQTDLDRAPIHPIKTANLGENLGDPSINATYPQYIGGIAIVLDDIDSPATLEDISQRIARMRNQPQYADAAFYDMTVLGLRTADGAVLAEPATPADDRAFSRAVVLVRDESTNYAQRPELRFSPESSAALNWRLVVDALGRETSLGNVSNFSSQISSTMQQQALVALLLSLLAIVVYVWFRFGSLRYGLAAIAALVHDVCIALGLVALAGLIATTDFGRALDLADFKIDLALVAAMLTIIGYSLNDTIVVFDRIRENRGRLAVASPAVINDSINQTISRTVLTSGTTFIAALVLYVLGGPGVHGFAFAIGVGVVVGTYSSIAIGSPLLLVGASSAKPAADDAADTTGPAPARY